MIRTWVGTLRNVIALQERGDDWNPIRVTLAGQRFINATASTGRIHDRSRSIAKNANRPLPGGGRPYMTFEFGGGSRVKSKLELEARTDGALLADAAGPLRGFQPTKKPGSPLSRGRAREGVRGEGYIAGSGETGETHEPWPRSGREKARKRPGHQGVSSNTTPSLCDPPP